MKLSANKTTIIVHLYECAEKEQNGQIVLDPAIMGKVVMGVCFLLCS